MIRHRNMSAAELGIVLDWASEEGWNPGLDDAAAFHAADPDGFFLATDGEVPVAAISVVNHSDRFSFLGLYLCRREYRGRGIGFGLWSAAIAHAGNRTVGLDGVPEQQDNYARSGFVHAGGTTRYSGAVAGRRDPRIRQAGEADISVLVEAEAAASGWVKTAYLSNWFRPAATRKTFVMEDAADGPGFATIRTCRTGAKIGPLVAHSPEVARHLIKHAAAHASGDIIIDVPSTSGPLHGICAEFGLSPGFRTARMYRGPAPSSAGTPVFAVTTLELG